MKPRIMKEKWGKKKKDLFLPMPVHIHTVASTGSYVLCGIDTNKVTFTLKKKKKQLH